LADPAGRLRRRYRARQQPVIDFGRVGTHKRLRAAKLYARDLGAAGFERPEKKLVKIAIIDDWQGVARSSADWSRLAARAELVFFADAFGSEDDAALALADFDIILTMRERTAFPKRLISRLTKLRMICITGPSNPTVDVEACTRQGVTVCNTPRSNALYATAELALGLMIAAARAIPAADKIMRAGGFQTGVPVGMGLAGKTLGIVGLGRLGARLARSALALDMKIIAWSPNLTAGKAEEAGAVLVGKSDLMSGADVISVHMVLSPRTRGLVGAEDIARMKQGAILINTSRGPLIHEAALLAAVQAGKIIAALDVYDGEPLPKDHPLRASDHTVLTPHLGYGVDETWRQFYPQSVENAEAFLDGKPIRVVNAQKT
jgi:phosphoglycerate dehydrogenase-like enzyme